MNPDYFFADPDDEEEKFGRSERAIAVAACRRCPLMHECFQHAITHEIMEGVWGGSVPQQRQAYINKVRLNIRQTEQRHGKK